MQETFEKLYGVKVPPPVIPIFQSKHIVISFMDCNIAVPALNSMFHVLHPNPGHLWLNQTTQLIKNIKGQVLDVVYGSTDISGDIRVISRNEAEPVSILEDPGLIFDIHLWTLCPGTNWVYEATAKDCIICSYVPIEDGYMLSFQARTCKGWTLRKPQGTMNAPAT
jgi:hypothetical protein